MALQGALADQSTLYGLLGLLQNVEVVLLAVIRLEDSERRASSPQQDRERSLPPSPLSRGDP